MNCVLGLDTSCYTTSVAAVDTRDGHVLATCRELLAVPTQARGLQQSQAVFFHIRALPKLMAAWRKEVQEANIVAVCASTTPRSAPDSYMPVFCVGESVGRSLASALHVPFYGTDHQTGHLYSARVGTSLAAKEAVLALHLSGGTTELLRADGAQIECIGGTADVSAGQLVDRVGVALGLPFPCGPHLEALAMDGQANQRLGVSMTERGGRIHCHLSGAEAQAMRWIQTGALPPATIAAEIYALLTRTIARMIAAGCSKTGFPDVLLAGGVASSALFRSLLGQRVSKMSRTIRLHFAQPSLAGDNAVGVALVGLEALQQKKEGF